MASGEGAGHELENQVLWVEDETGDGPDSGDRLVGKGGGGAVSGVGDRTSGDEDSSDEDSSDEDSLDGDQDDSADQLSSLYFAACDSGHHSYWEGPHRNSRDAAQADADTHNQTCDARGANVWP